MAANFLFCRVPWYKFSTNALAQLKSSLNSTPGETIASGNTQELIERLASSHQIKVPTVHWDRPETTSRETEVNLGAMPGSMAHYAGQRTLRKGIEFEVKVTFEGDADFFDVQPETYSLNPPQARVERHSLIFTYTGLQADVEGWTRSFENSKREIEICLDNLRGSVERLLAQFEPTVRAVIQERKSHIEKAATDLDAFRARLIKAEPK
jgi:hypothetical protein